MGLLDSILNIATFGGHGRLEESKKRYFNIYDQYKNNYDNAVYLKKKYEDGIYELGLSTRKAFSTLEKAVHILGKGINCNHVEIRDNKQKQININGVVKAEKLLLEYSSVNSVAAGATVGSVAAIGSWSLVSLLGRASTGTAIVTLSGAAATNATLAWFGGGALAAGGAGMAGGSMLLGGIVLVPMIAYAVWNSHSMVKQIDAECDKIISENSQILRDIDRLENVCHVVKIQNEKICSEHQKLQCRYNEIRRKLFKYGVVSSIFRFSRSLFGGKYYLQDEEYVLYSLYNDVGRFAHCFDFNHVSEPASPCRRRRRRIKRQKNICSETCISDPKGIIVSCESCGKRNRLPFVRIGLVATCGKCQTPLAFASVPITISSVAVFNALITESSLPVLVGFEVKSEILTQMVTSKLKIIAGEESGKLLVAFINIQDFPDILKIYNVQNIPVVLIFRNGVLVAQKADNLSVSSIKEFIYNN